jgi:hypothetical protein
VTEVVRRDQQRPDLGQPGLGEFAVVVPGEGAEQGGPLHAEQIVPRMLIDHQQMLGANESRLPRIFYRVQARTAGRSTAAKYSNAPSQRQPSTTLSTPT